MHLFSVKRIPLFILSLALICTLPMICDASGLKSDKTQEVSIENVEEQFKKAVNLLNMGSYEDHF